MKAFRIKEVDTPIIAVTGGKGGTGKTTVAVNLAVGLQASGLRVLLVDVDVDGPCCATLLGIKLERGEEITTFLPLIDETECVKCGKCVEVCREHALVGFYNGVPKLFEELCSGCKACQIACVYGAVGEGQKLVGTVYTAESNGLRLISGELKPTEPRSPIMARATVKKALEEMRIGGYDVAIMDTAPGVHNTVAQALWVADLAVAVTEPTTLGVHDLKFILDLTQDLELPTEIVINKFDIPGGLKEEIHHIANDRGVQVATEIPIDDELLHAYVTGEPLLKKPARSQAARSLSFLTQNILEKLKRMVYYEK